MVKSNFGADLQAQNSLFTQPINDNFNTAFNCVQLLFGACIVYAIEASC